MQGQGMSLPVRRAILSKDVGQLQSWLRQGLRPEFAFAAVAIQVVERADGGGHGVRAHLGVTRGGLDAAVAEQDHMLEEFGYFGRAEDYRQFVWHAASRQRVLDR